MTDEEIKAIDDLISSHYSDVGISKESYFIIKNLIENQQKEIEELRLAINVLNHEKGEWIDAYTQEKDEKFEMLNNSISKQKIKDKIYGIIIVKDSLKENKKELILYSLYDIYTEQINILEELLEETK